MRKDDLITLGKHLCIEIKSTMRKREMQRQIVEYLVQQKTFEQSVLTKYLNTQDQSTKNSQVTLIEQNSDDELSREKIQWREQEERKW